MQSAITAARMPIGCNCTAQQGSVPKLSCINAGIQKPKPRAAGWNSNLARPPIGRDKEDVAQSFTDYLPDWMGYGFLYFVTIIPIIIVVVTVSIVFVSSLK